MIKIKISEIFRHRNETTFRPFIQAQHLFREVGIDFIFEGNKQDLTWVGQASFADKNHPLERAISRGLWFLENKVDGDYVLFDGQDSATLICAYEVFKKSAALRLMKNTLYSDPSAYRRSTPHGRIYWKSLKSYTDISYSIPDYDPTNILLSGANWLSTVTPNWFRYAGVAKDIDVCALFSYPAKANMEFLHTTSPFYDEHRRYCISQLNALPPNISVAKLVGGQHYSISEYYNIMSRSKIIIAPFGYGEIAPRDIESAMLGSVLIKPDMTHIETVPNPYISGKTFVNCAWDFSDLRENIENVLGGWPESQEYFVENMRREYVSQYNPEKLVLHTYNWLSQLDGFGGE